MTAETLHTPTPEFRAGLEHEVVREFRRRARFAALRRARRGRLLRAAAIVVACIGMGAAGGLASAQVRDNARRDSLLQSVQADAELISLRLELARAALDDALRKSRVGAAGPEAVAAAQAQLATMEAQAARVMLNMEEIRVTAQAPRDELTAPLAGNRDFVSDRLKLELAAAQNQLDAAERALAEASRRTTIGVATRAEQIEAEVRMARARAILATLMDRRSLRREFLEKGTTADELARRHESAQLRQELAVAQEVLELARVRLETVQRQFGAGATSRLEVMRAEVEVQERELELRQLRLRLQRLELPRG
jgi:hypothetical protein